MVNFYETAYQITKYVEGQPKVKTVVLLACSDTDSPIRDVDGMSDQMLAQEAGLTDEEI